MKTENGVMMQYFEWYLPKACGLWKRLKEEAPALAEKGFTALWLPPAYKGQRGDEEVGYAVYDLYDLGEFDQKGTVPTKYGTMKEYIEAVEACRKAGISVYTDIVFNHMVEGDELETVDVVDFDWNDRNQQVDGPKTIQALSRFTFPGRNGKYNSFVWDKNCFSGSDTDELSGARGIFQFQGSKWSESVDDENGNYDYLLGLNVNFSNPDVVAYLLDWGQWYYDTVKPDGFRLDALKHIDYNFFPGWLQELRAYSGKELFTVGEYWKGDVNKLLAYLENAKECMSLFDVPLHYNLHNITVSSGAYDLSQVFQGTLTEADPVHSVTFVDNHDTQPTQALESCIEEWFLPHSYALILLRAEGYPCVFYGDYYGLDAREGRNIQPLIDQMLKARRHRMYGECHSYFDDFDVIGWTFEGEARKKNSGLAVILSDKDAGEKKMFVGQSHAGETWKDLSGAVEEPVVIDEEGNGVFRCNPASVSFYGKTSHKDS